jgi:hypothetical protein
MILSIRPYPWDRAEALRKLSSEALGFHGLRLPSEALSGILLRAAAKPSLRFRRAREALSARS